MTEPAALSPEAQEQLKAAVNTALASPGAARGFLSNIPDLSALGETRTKVIGVIDGVLGAINTIQQYAWVIPDQYEEPIEKLEAALTKVKGWLD